MRVVEAVWPRVCIGRAQAHLDWTKPCETKVDLIQVIESWVRMNNARSDIKVSFDSSKPNYSEIGTDSLNVSGSSMNLSDLSENRIIEQFMRALGYDACTLIKYNLNLRRTPCQINKLLEESIINTEKRNSRKKNDVEWLRDTYKVTANYDCDDNLRLEQHNRYCSNYVNKIWSIKTPKSSIPNTLTVQFVENYRRVETIDYEAKKKIVIDVIEKDLQPFIGIKFEFLTPVKLENYIRSNKKPDIRITLLPDDFNFSYIGTESKTSIDERSMNLADLDKRTILKQFIAAIGFESCNIIKYYLDSGFTICNALKELETNSILSTELGRDNLSENDKKMLQSIYPLENNKTEKKKSILNNKVFIWVLIILVISIVFIIFLSYK